MKTTSPLAAAKAVVIASCGLIAASSDLAAQANSPSIPVGWLNAAPTVVRTGTKPSLSWGITYPSDVKDFIEIVPPSTINPKSPLDVEVRVLGNGVTISYSNSSTTSEGFAQAAISFDGGAYFGVFAGYNSDVNPNTVVWSRTNVTANQTIRFGGRHYLNGWQPFYHSTSGTNNVRTLVNGDIPPNKVPAHNAPSLKDFIRPYLGNNGKVKIGPMDVIVFMETTHTDSQQNNVGYDLQDLVLLVTFKESN